MSVVMAFGGWGDSVTTRRHNFGEFSPEANLRECEKIDFLDGESGSDRLRSGTMSRSSPQQE